MAISIEQTLLELFGDPDKGWRFERLSVKDLRQQKAVASGEREEPLEDPTRRLNLD
jgi:hypothetical protein